MEALKSVQAAGSLDRLAESLSGNEMTKAVADALKNGNSDEIRRLLENANEALKALDEEAKKELAGHFEKAAAEVAGDRELAQSLSALSRSIMSGDLKGASGALKNLSDTLASLAENNSRLAQAMSQYYTEMFKQLEASLNEARHRAASRDGSDLLQGDNGQNISGREGNQPGEGQDGNSGEGNSSGKGEGSSGSGDGKGDKGGSGAGNGTSNRDSGYSGPGTGGGSRLPGDRQVVEYERIYVPERLGGDNDESQVRGSKGSSGSSQWTEAEGVPVEKGSIIPYNAVLGEYRNEAMSKLKDSSVPPVMKDIVRDYFTALE